MKVLGKYLLVGAFASVFALGACASNDSGSVLTETNEISDPLEKTNRAVFKFNNVVDDNIIHPAISGYRYVVPSPARTGLDNFLKNLRSPVVFANQLLQGDLEGAGNVLVRASVNTLVGFGGLLDVAQAEGIDYEGEDFGQTLAVWGVDHGPYLVVPILGPSSTRDYAGYLVDSFADPLRWYLFNVDKEGLAYARTGASYVVLRDNLMDLLEELQESSIDYYAATRSIYYQRRDAEVRDDNTNGASSIPDYDE